MGELRMPEDLKDLRVMFVRRSSPAFGAMMKLVKQAPLKPGQIVPITDEEFDSLKEDVLSIRVSGKP